MYIPVHPYRLRLASLPVPLNIVSHQTYIYSHESPSHIVCSPLAHFIHFTHNTHIILIVSTMLSKERFFLGYEKILTQRRDETTGSLKKGQKNEIDIKYTYKCIHDTSSLCVLHTWKELFFSSLLFIYYSILLIFRLFLAYNRFTFWYILFN